MTTETFPVLSFRFKDKPIPWQRPSRFGSRYFDPQLTAKENIRAEVTAHLEELSTSSFKFPTDIPLACYYHFFFPIPSSYSKKRQASLKRKPFPIRPDLSNLIKFYEDALQGLIFYDDKQIVKINAIKAYDSVPSTNLIISSFS